MGVGAEKAGVVANAMNAMAAAIVKRMFVR
jgi:hypothetical protein